MIRGKGFGIRFSTRLSLDEVEGWLAGNCVGDWDVRLSEIIEDSHERLWKRLEILFACPEDRARFQERYFPDAKTGAAGSKNSAALSSREREFV